jgi:NAD(P)-dependent dehydrogenase (short-subunit alcohol dehydrogenase family)
VNQSHENYRSAFVTGGARGIGKEIVRKLCGAGYEVTFSYNSSGDAARNLVSELSELGGRVSAVKLSLSELARGSAGHEILQRIMASDIVVNNAATSEEVPFEELTHGQWIAILENNLIAPSRVAAIAIPGMIRREFGRIINIASIGGQTGGVNQFHYAASKAGLISLSKSLSNRYSNHGITANSVSPGLVLTDMSAAELSRDDGQKKLSRVPIGRVGTPVEVANVVAFIASDEASYLTGQTINVNGGSFLG